MLASLVPLLFLAQCGGACDTASPGEIPLAEPTPDIRPHPSDPPTTTEMSDPIRNPGPIVEAELMTRLYGMSGTSMRRGLVPFGERVLVVAHPEDDHTPQHVLAVDAAGQASYLRADGTFAELPRAGSSVVDPAILRGEGVEADYADGLLALLNSDSLSDWTDSGFLDWGAGQRPDGEPTAWSTQVPLVWRESHQRTVAVLGPVAGRDGTLVVGHVGRLFRDADRRQPVHYPSAMVSMDRGRSWTWGPEIEGIKPPAGAYAAAWPDAPGGGAVLYFALTLPGDDSTPPLALFRPDDAADHGVSLDTPHASQLNMWGEHAYQSSGRTFVPQPIRHWVTRHGLVLETATRGLFWMPEPEGLPRRIRSEIQTSDQPNRTVYLSVDDELVRILPSGAIEQLDDPASSAWRAIGEIERPAGTRWVQAAASDGGTLWLLGHTRSGKDVTVATWPSGAAF